MPGHPIQIRSQDFGSEDKPIASPPGLGRRSIFLSFIVILNGSLLAMTSKRLIRLLAFWILHGLFESQLGNRRILRFAGRILVFSAKTA
jgi:hypothetical protein